jgi:hypothetical protein
MSLLDSATNAVTTATTALSTGPASALSAVGDAVGGVLKSAGSFLTTLGGSKLPLPNVLSAYTTYNYVLSIGVLTDNDINYPDSTYMAGKQIPLICKSANAEPFNRIATAYGKFDFFIDNLSLTSNVGFEKSSNTNVFKIGFSITEPYSMGMFTIALQTAAFQAGWKNYRDAPFLLKIEFRGNDINGMKSVPNATRYIPFKFIKIGMKVNEKGSVYDIKTIPFNHQALSKRNTAFKSDVAFKGATVQEMLQTGEKSLQAVINQRLQQQKEDNQVKVPDEVLILFPTDVASSASAAASTSNKESKGGATTSTAGQGGGGGGALFEKLGVAKSKLNKTLVQPDGQCNALGKASMGFGLDKRGDPAFGSENKIWDAKNRVWARGNSTSNVKEGEFRFTQDTDIVNAINQVLLASNYPSETLDPGKLTPEGMRNWWRIDTQYYSISSDENDDSTGKKPSLIVYRVVPYQVGTDRTNPPNTAPPGIKNLKKQVVKEYNYLYTGKNTEIMKFDIEFNTSFSIRMAADGLKRSQDVQLDSGSTAVKTNVIDPQPDGSKVVPKAGVIPTSVSYDLTATSSDRFGGGGPDTMATRAARVFHDAITNGVDMLKLNMEIWGDPYYIAQSGTGNYTSKPSAFQNLNSDGTMNYQNGEVHIGVNFRTPIDINQSTGLYNFAGGNSAPVVQFSGLYRVRQIVSTFNNGQFKQTLTGSRVMQQENPTAGTAAKTFTTSNTTPDTGKP